MSRILPVVGLKSTRSPSFHHGCFVPPADKEPDDNTWIGLLSVLECGIGLIAGSMPFLGRLLHLYESTPSGQQPEPLGDDGARPTIGGIPGRVVNKTGSIPLFSMAGETRQSITSCTKLTNIAKDDGISQQQSYMSSDDATQSRRGS